MLLKINERKTWSDPPPTDEAKRAKQDDDIFQTARLVKCVFFLVVELEAVLCNDVIHL